jgi:hypothetical protein
MWVSPAGHRLSAALTYRSRYRAVPSATLRAISDATSATSVGVWPTRTPRASSASCLAFAVPLAPDTIAPA